MSTSRRAVSVRNIELHLWDTHGNKTPYLWRARYFKFRGKSGKYLKTIFAVPTEFRRKADRESYIVAFIESYFEELEKRLAKRAKKEARPAGFKILPPFSRRLSFVPPDFINVFRFIKTYAKPGIEIDPVSIFEIVNTTVIPSCKAFHRKYGKEFHMPPFREISIGVNYTINFVDKKTGEASKFAILAVPLAEPSIIPDLTYKQFEKWWIKEKYDSFFFLFEIKCFMQFEYPSPVFDTGPDYQTRKLKASKKKKSKRKKAKRGIR